MDRYLTAQICMNGHYISGSVDQNPERSAAYCTKCGEKTISSCVECGAPIRGDFYYEGFISTSREDNVPFYCHNCGRPYPWTNRILNAATDLLASDDSLDGAAKELIKAAIPDLIVDSPRAPVSAAKYRNAMASAGEFIKNAMYNLLVDVLSETAKKLIYDE